MGSVACEGLCGAVGGALGGLSGGLGRAAVGARVGAARIVCQHVLHLVQEERLLAGWSKKT